MPQEGASAAIFVRLDEIAPMHETVGFRTLKIAGVEPAISADDASYNTLEGKQRDLWLDLLFKVSAEQSIVASSRHILYVGQRPDDESHTSEYIRRKNADTDY